jgi:hypothetical protein
MKKGASDMNIKGQGENSTYVMGNERRNRIIDRIE